MCPSSGVNFDAFLSRFQTTCWSRRWVAFELMPGRPRRHGESLLLGFDVGLGNFHGVLDRLVQVHRRTHQLHLAAGDAGDVQQIVHEMRFELDVAADHRERFPHRLGKVLAAGKRLRGHEDRGQRRAKFMGKHGHKMGSFALPAASASARARSVSWSAASSSARLRSMAASVYRRSVMSSAMATMKRRPSRSTPGAEALKAQRRDSPARVNTSTSASTRRTLPWKSRCTCSPMTSAPAPVPRVSHWSKVGRSSRV